MTGWDFVGVYGQRRTAESVASLHRRKGFKVRIRYNQGNHIVERRPIHKPRPKD